MKTRTKIRRYACAPLLLFGIVMLGLAVWAARGKSDALAALKGIENFDWFT